MVFSWSGNYLRHSISSWINKNKTLFVTNQSLIFNSQSIQYDGRIFLDTSEVFQYQNYSTPCSGAQECFRIITEAKAERKKNSAKNSISFNKFKILPCFVLDILWSYFLNETYCLCCTLF